MTTRRKPLSTSVFHSLPTEQRETIKHWLFEDNLAYAEVMKRCKREFQARVGKRSLIEFFRQTQQQRNIAQILAGSDQANEVVKKLADNPVDTYRAIMNLTGQLAFNAATQAVTGGPSDLDPLRRSIELFLETRKDDREAQRLLLEREKWELDVARLCFEHQTELQAITADKSMDEDARLQAIRRRLFGANLPD